MQHVSWQLGPEQIERVAPPGVVLKVSIDHPRCRAIAVPSEETHAELARDLG